jgi:hypothetical protein
MEFGDIIYFILLLFFAILGFFNESRKKKNLQQQQGERDSRPLLAEEEHEPYLHHLPLPQARELPPTVPPPQKNKRHEFQSSLDLVTDFEGVSSLKNSIFVYETSVFTLSEQENHNDKNKALHPLVVELTGESGEEALKRGLIYGEIMQRKY